MRNYARVAVIGWVVALLLSASPLRLHATLAEGPANDLTCREVLPGGEFESSGTWHKTPLTKFVAPETAHTREGKRAMRLGIVQGKNVRNYASIWQTVQIPKNAVRAVLDMWVLPVSDDPTTGSDRQEIRVLDSHYRLLLTPLRGLLKGNDWQQVTVDLAQFRGETVRIYVNVFNDGSGGKTALYVDSVHLTICEPRGLIDKQGGEGASATPADGGLTPTPPVSPTPSPSPPPSAASLPAPGTCGDLVQNGDFEEGSAGWVLGATPKPATILATRSHSGTHAMRLGVVGGSDYQSYSSFWQTVEVPSDTITATLSFWAYRLTEDTDGGDSQVALVLDDKYRIRQRPLHAAVTDGDWVYFEKDLSAYRGWTLRLYFNVFNDGDGKTSAMYVDGVQLLACR
ncbi:MAG: hypothetical protein GXP41_03490 [Chloroflexi bacterium]|nr:hypothetical protein [Chloroflexota bacterium]